MRKILNILILLFFIYSFSIQAQSTSTITPNWSATFGEKEHTSRDDLYRMKFDNDSNLMVIGNVERDTSFSDIMVQKYSKDGIKLWQHRYSSGRHLDYDHPQDLLVDKMNNIIVLGSVATNTTTYGSTFEETMQGELYVYKLDSNGKLLWETLIPGMEMSQAYVRKSHMMLDENKIHLFYFDDYKPFAKFSTYEISEDGILTRSDSISNVNEEGIPGVPLAISSNNDGTIFILNNQFDTPNFWLSEISKTGQKSYKILGEKFSAPQNWEIVKSDAMGNFYVIDNSRIIGNSSDTFEYSIHKITTEGQHFTYSVSSSDHFVALENLNITNEGIILLGRIRKEEKTTSTFLTKLNSDLQFIDSIHFSNMPHFVPQNVVYSNHNIYVILDNDTTTRSKVLKLDDSFNITGEYLFNTPQGYTFYFSDLLDRTKRLYVAGTILTVKFENSQFLSENEFYIESFSMLNEPTKHWTQIYSDSGTSYTSPMGLVQHNNSETYILTLEYLGPECFPIYNAPKEPVLIKYDISGKMIWKTRLDYGFALLFDFKTAIDHLGNFYLLAQKSNKNVLVKVSSDGKNIKDASITLPRSLFVDKDNHIYINSEVRDEYVNYITDQIEEFDSDLNLISRKAIKGRILQLFQIEDNDSLYYYTYDAGEWGKSRLKDLSLYVNNKLKWTCQIDMSSPYDGYITSDLNKNNGYLYFLTEYGSTDKFIHRLSLSGEHKSIALENGIGDFLDIKSLSNGNVIVNRRYHWELFSEDLLKQSTKYLDIKSKALIKSNYLFMIEEGRIIVYDDNIEQIAEFKNPKFDKATFFCLNDQFEYFSLKNPSKSLPIHWSRLMFGHQSQIGELSMFKLSDKIDFSKPISSDPQFLINTTGGTSTPTTPETPSNPTDINKTEDKIIEHLISNSQIMIYCEQSIDSDAKVNLYNIRGQLVYSKIWNKGTLSTQIHMDAMQRGFYILQVEDEGKPIYINKVIW